jgi:hypothetical protein
MVRLRSNKLVNTGGVRSLRELFSQVAGCTHVNHPADG